MNFGWTLISIFGFFIFSLISIFAIGYIWKARQRCSENIISNKLSERTTARREIRSSVNPALDRLLNDPNINPVSANSISSSSNNLYSVRYTVQRPINSITGTVIKKPRKKYTRKPKQLKQPKKSKQTIKKLVIDVEAEI